MNLLFKPPLLYSIDLVNLLDGLRSLCEDAELYKQVMLREDEVQVEVRLTDTDDSATLIIGQDLSLLKGSSEPDLRLTMTSNIFNQVMSGEADFGALIGRSKMSDIRPINGEFLNPDKLSQCMEVLSTFMTIFFTPGKKKTRRLSESLAGEAHGAHPIPIVYWDGVRYAWYLVKKGEVLNESLERDPYPQAFIILKGKGKISLENTKMDLETNRVYYIPSNMAHQIIPIEDVELLWIAWKTP
jgi:mannose-6-phosphate isomerase-like protein (cupin superfamily)